MSPIPIWRKSQKTDFDQKNGSISSNPATIRLLIPDLYFLFRAWSRRPNITCYIPFDAEKSGLSLEPFCDMCHLSRFGENCENNRFQAKKSPSIPSLKLESSWRQPPLPQAGGSPPPFLKLEVASPSPKLEAAPPPPSSWGERPSSLEPGLSPPLPPPKNFRHEFRPKFVGPLAPAFKETRFHQPKFHPYPSPSPPPAIIRS